MIKKYTGTCGCGAVEITFTGNPINAVFCYCTDCQKDTGSDKWFGLWVKNDDLTFSKGEPETFTRLGTSGKPVHKKFCGACGATLCSDFTAGGFYSVAASILQQKNDFAPKMAIYTASAVRWAVFPESVPKYDMFPA
ncbi:MAG: GFA family protein [Pseudomonadota bacterium]